MSNNELIDYIRKYFIYHDDGTFSRTDRKNTSSRTDYQGYKIMKIKGKLYRVHRLVYAYFYGYFPVEIDHINRIRDDNRIENLRETDRIHNVLNTTGIPNATTGEVGIYEDRSTKGLKKRYTFRIQGKTFRFYTIEEAKEAKSRLRKEYYGI